MMDEVTSPFPLWDVKAAWADIYDEFSRMHNGNPPKLPKAPEKVGGHPVSVMIGIRYLKLFPKLLFHLPSGLGIYESQLECENGIKLVLAGPHKAWNYAVNRANYASAHFYMSSECRAFYVQSQCLNAPISACPTKDYSDVPVDSLLMDFCENQHCPDQDGLYTATRGKNKVAEFIAKMANLIPPPTTKEEEEGPPKKEPLVVGGYFARIIPDQEPEKYKSKSSSRYRKRSRSRKRSRFRKRLCSRRRSWSQRSRSRRQSRSRWRSRSCSRRRSRSRSRRRSRSGRSTLRRRRANRLLTPIKLRRRSRRRSYSRSRRSVSRQRSRSTRRRRRRSRSGNRRKESEQKKKKRDSSSLSSSESPELKKNKRYESSDSPHVV